MPIKEALPSRRGFLFGAAAAAVAVSFGNALVTPAEALILRGAPVPGGGSYINVPDAATLMAILNAGPAASGGKRYRLAAANFGSLGIYNYDFRSNPILISGQPTPGQTTASDFGINSSGMTWENITFNGTVSPSIQVNDNTNVPVVLTFNNIITNSGDPMGTQTGNGWEIFCPTLPGSSVTINGQGDSTKFDIWGRDAAMVILGTQVGGGTVTVNNLSYSNFGTDGIIGAGAQNVTLNAVYGTNGFGNGGHPDFCQFFSNGDIPTTNLTVINSLFLQGMAGTAPQGVFLEDAVTVLIKNTAVYSDGQNNAFSNARGSGQTNDNNFCQHFTSTGMGGVMIARGAAVNSVNTNNSVGALVNNSVNITGPYTTDGVNPGYVPASNLGSNTLIPAATANGDYTQLDIWLANHLTCRRRA